MTDYADLSYEDLKQKREEIDALMQERREEALETFKQQAAMMGFDLSMVAANMNGKPVKFRDPDNPENTYSGKGKHPQWLSEKIIAGHDIEEFRVGTI